jgi:hypothetical protein
MRFTVSRKLHPWFAWHPVKIRSFAHYQEGNCQMWEEEWVWLERIEKKGVYYVDYRYRQ